MVNAGQQDVERDLVGRLLALGPFDQRNHPVRGRSRPGSPLIRTISQSERTRVPPVTALRSPPLSRMTGALSPVIGALVHRGDPFDHLAVGRDGVARLDQHHVALRKCRGRDHRVLGAVARHACRRLAVNVPAGAFAATLACALPRPSAIASAKLAKSTVNQSQTEIARMNPAGASPLPNSAWMNSPVVSMRRRRPRT